MAKYSKAAQKGVESAMKKMEKGTLKSGKSNKKVTNPKQAIAIGLSEAKKKGAKVPEKKTVAKKGVAKKAAKPTIAKKAVSKKATVKKAAVKKAASKKTVSKKAATKKTAQTKQLKKNIRPVISQASINGLIASDVPPVEEKSQALSVPLENNDGPIIETDKRALAKALTKNDFKHPMHLSRGKQTIKSSSRKILWR